MVIPLTDLLLAAMFVTRPTSNDFSHTSTFIAHVKACDFQ